MEVPETGSLCDFLWSDPTENQSGYQTSLYEFNDSRGCAFYFGLEATRNFLEANNLLTVIRSFSFSCVFGGRSRCLSDMILKVKCY